MEEWSFFEVIESIDFSESINTLAAIGTFITSIVSLLTLNVVMKQRKDSFKPKVILNNKVFGQSQSKKEEVLKSYWIESYLNDDVKSKDLAFEILNVGVGVALDVTLAETFDHKKGIDFIDKIDKYKELRYNYTRRGGLEITTTFDDSILWMPINDKKREFGNFLPNEDAEPKKYTFDRSYLAFLSCFEYLREKFDLSPSLLKDFPELKLKIGYKDIENKSFQENYRTEVQTYNENRYLFTLIRE